MEPGMTSVEQGAGFDGHKYGYDESYIIHGKSPLWRKRLHDILKQGHRSGRLLDIGCNYGFFLRECETHFETFGIDVSQHAVAQANVFASKSQLALYDVQQGLPYDDGAFEVVTMFDTLEHLKNYNEVLKEIHRVLKDGGLLVLTTPNRWSINSILFGRDYWTKRDKTHVVVFSRNSLKNVLALAGFRQLRIRTISFLHFLGDFGRVEDSTGPNLATDSSMSRAAKNLPPALRYVLGKIYNLVNDLPTPWGANFYAFCVKQVEKDE